MPKNTLKLLNLIIMDIYYLIERDIARMHKGELTLEELKEQLHNLIDYAFTPENVNRVNQPGEL